MERNLLRYQESIGLELDAAMNRVRHLIGEAHWQTDGEHKESVLRRVLKDRLPESNSVGRGFVCLPAADSSAEICEPSGHSPEPVTSRQIDILITKKSEPSLYRDGDLTFVTPEAVSCLVEVKTGLTPSGLEEALGKLAHDVTAVRRLGESRSWAALFVYEERQLSYTTMLEKLHKTARSGVGAVNCVSLGEHWFFRFWKDGHRVSSVDGPVWHAYRLDNLARGYFVSNLAVNLGDQLSEAGESLWFPIPGTKEARRVAYISLTGGTVEHF